MLAIRAGKKKTKMAYANFRMTLPWSNLECYYVEWGVQHFTRFYFCKPIFKLLIFYCKRLSTQILVSMHTESFDELIFKYHKMSFLLNKNGKVLIWLQVGLEIDSYTKIDTSPEKLFPLVIKNWNSKHRSEFHKSWQQKQKRKKSQI